MPKKVINLLSLIFIFFFIFLNSSHSQIVKKIEVIGNERIPLQTIVMFSDINLNDDLSDSDINNIIKNLYETNFFKNIKIIFKEKILKIKVKENPIIFDIVIKGIKAQKLKDLVSNSLTIREKSSFNEILLINEKEKIILSLKNQGYLFAKLDILVEELEGNKINLVFDINLGKKQKLKNFLCWK